MGPLDIRLTTCLGRRWKAELMRHAAAQRSGAWLTLSSRQAASEPFQALQVCGVILLSRGAKVDTKEVWTVSTPWASDSVVPASDWAGLGMFSGEWRIFKGSGWFESHLGQVFSLFRGF
jgi:hypothetical protein